MIQKIHRILWVIIIGSLLLITLVSVRSLFDAGYFPMHDDAQIARVVTMGNALLHGQFPVRMVSGLGYGYGYPLFNFYGPLPYYIGGSLYALGIPAITATKWMMGIGVLIGSISAFLLVKTIYGKLGGIFGAVMFTFFPYRAVQLFVRGAIGELWATSFLPLVVLSYIWMFDKKKRIYAVLLGTLSLSGVILSHTVYAYITVGVLLLLLLSYWAKLIITVTFDWKLCTIQIITLILALDCTAFFWMPALAEMNYTNVFSAINPSANVLDHFICLPQFWDSPWGYGGSTTGCLDGMSFKLGKFHIACVVLSLIMLIFSIKTNKEKIMRRWTILGVSILTGSLFMMLPVSSFLWKILPYAEFVQYPWRILAIVDLGILLIVPYFISVLPKYMRTMTVIIFIVFCIGLNSGLFQPNYTYVLSENQAISSEDIGFRASQVSDEYLPPEISKPKTVKEIITTRIRSNATITVLSKTETEIYGKYLIESSETISLTLSMAYFPGWKIFLNNTPVYPTIERGLPSVVVSEGRSTVEVKFENTPIRIIGNVLSLTTVFLLIILYAKKTIT